MWGIDTASSSIDLDVTRLVADIRSALAAESDPVRAAGQQAYMKSSMPFYGVSVPRTRAIVRSIARPLLTDVAQVETVPRALWDAATHREALVTPVGVTIVTPGQYHFSVDRSDA